MGYVYLILEVNQHGEEYHKIGISKNEPEKRLKQLSTGNPNEIRLLNVYESINYKKVEQWLHSRYSTRKTLSDNEWFNLTNEQVLSFIDTCKKADETISLLLKENPFFK
jgi:hypothetical protein